MLTIVNNPNTNQHKYANYGKQSIDKPAYVC